MNQDTQKTIVIFRQWRANPKTIIALFPDEPADRDNRYCQSYEHHGQHGGADYQGVIARTIPTTDYQDLKRELEGLGYNLEVRQRRVRP